jgi:hypothetical protein
LARECSTQPLAGDSENAVALNDVSIGSKAIFELRAEMVSQGELGCAVGAILSSNSRGSQFCGYGKTERYVRVKLMTTVPMATALTS